jgi:hypothetical protein
MKRPWQNFHYDTRLRQLADCHGKFHLAKTQ